MEIIKKALKHFLILIAFMFLYKTSSYSQTYFGIRVEPLFYIARIDKEIYSPTPSKTTNHSAESNVNASLNFSIKLSEDYRLSFRPGFIFGNLYSGLNDGAFVSYYLSPKSYLISGINTHFRGGWGGHTYSGDNITTPYIVIGYGYHGKKFPIEFQINYPLNHEKYGTYKEQTGGPSYSTIWWRYSVAVMIKLSFGFEWEL